MNRRRACAAVVVLAISIVVGSQPVAAQASTPHFSSCTAMHKVYKHGVGKSGAHDHVRGSSKPVTNFVVSTTIYNRNKSLDRDKDGVACEAH